MDSFGVEFSVVAEKLLSFETADDLADYFRSYGIVARPRDSRHCPISTFVATETGLNPVTNLQAVMIEDEEQKIIESVLHSSAMRSFVLNFDGGQYPDLVEKGYEVAFIPNNYNYYNA